MTSSRRDRSDLRETGVSDLYGRYVRSRRTPEGPDALVAQIAARQHGTIHVDQLHACGVTERMIRVRVARGWLHPLYRAVYAVGHAAVTFEGRCFGGVLACECPAWVARSSSAVLAGMCDDGGIEGRVQVLVAAREAPRLDGIDVRCSLMVEPADVTLRSGIPCTSSARTLVDLAAEVGEEDLKRMLRTALGLRLTSLPQILEVKKRLGPRRGSKRLAKVLARSAQPTRSELENVVLDLLLDAGFEEPDVNVPLYIEGQRVVPDFRWPSVGLIVEADGAAWHGDNAVARVDDEKRQRLIEKAGDRVERVTWVQAMLRRSETVARVRRAGAPYAETGETDRMGR